MKQYWPWLLSAFLAVAPALGQTAATDTEAEIVRLRKQLLQVQNERQRNRADLEKDKKESAEYAARTRKRLASLQEEMEQMKAQIIIQRQKKDSLEALIGAAQRQQREMGLLQDNARATLTAQCGRLEIAARAVPPLISSQAVAAAQLLKSELTVKTTANMEALNRFQQIILPLQEATASIQVSQENSPVPEIRGTVYRLRVGTFYEAVVDLKGEKAVIWDNSAPGGAVSWKIAENPEFCRALLNTAKVREGKSLPGFCQLPFLAALPAGGGK